MADTVHAVQQSFYSIFIFCGTIHFLFTFFTPQLLPSGFYFFLHLFVFLLAESIPHFLESKYFEPIFSAALALKNISQVKLRPKFLLVKWRSHTNFKICYTVLIVRNIVQLFLLSPQTFIPLTSKFCGKKRKQLIFKFKRTKECCDRLFHEIGNDNWAPPIFSGVDQVKFEHRPVSFVQSLKNPLQIFWKSTKTGH